MTTIAQRRMALEEFLRLRERTPALEFIDGEVTQKGAAKAQHGALQLEGATLINAFARPSRLVQAFPETRATFAGRSSVPDVVVHRWERVPTTPDGEVADDFMLPPDIAIEVISPGQTVTKLSERCRWFVAHGATVALLVIPRRRTVYRFIKGGGRAHPDRGEADRPRRRAAGFRADACDAVRGAADGLAMTTRGDSGNPEPLLMEGGGRVGKRSADGRPPTEAE